ncbi:hypothetical protein [Hymenobacter yonginensis]|uniref:Uncharacterized protein n=1 Tax=Hymenobacter yonginensis TaxID=748197 RepID=A0ABY7PV55_9BACT|nr:hypothetical protein [Hymenobacter yonginensis]WBO86703.1 hypothetical protein O9Z63_20700 [Hymenobacter yonginensis]
MIGSYLQRLVLRSGFIVLGAFSLAALPAAAQEATISDLGASYYRGFRTVEGQVYFMLRQERNVYDLFHLEVYGRNLQKKGTTDVRLGRNWYQGDARMVGDQAVFYFFTGKEGLLLTVDATGQKFKEVRFPANDVWMSQAVIMPAGNGDFYLAYPFDSGNTGYAVARYGPDLSVKWKKDYAPEKGKYRVRFAQADAAHVYVVADHTKGTFEVVCLDGPTGAEQLHQDLPAEATSLTPTFAGLGSNGHLLLTGTYAETAQKTPLVSVSSANMPPRGGLFTLALGPDGKPDFLTRLSYAQDLAGKLNTRSTLPQFTVGETPGVKVHAFLPRPGGGYALLGETFKTFSFTDPQYEAAGGVRAPGLNGTAGPGPLRRDILDFVVFQFTAQGQLESLRRIPKPYKIYSDQAVGGGGNAEFNNKTVYAYRFLYQRDPAKLPEVVFFNWHQGLLYVNSLKPATDARDNLFTRRYLDQPAVPGGPDLGELTVRTYSNDIAGAIDYAPAALFFDEVLPHAPGKFLYSHYDPATSRLHLQVLDVPGN